MKQLKTSGLAAIVALALASLGASSASASVLCQGAPNSGTNVCEAGKYPVGTKLSGSLKTGTVATLTNSLGNVTCEKSVLIGELLNAGSSSTNATGVITSFSFGHCTRSGQLCTVTTTLESGKNHHAEVLATSGGNGTLVVTKGTNGQNPGAFVECGSFIKCTFTREKASLSVIGGAPATAIANKISLLRSGGLCPSEATWDAEYTLSPSPLYVAAG
jgi:hypothetical protein